MDRGPGQLEPCDKRSQWKLREGNYVGQKILTYSSRKVTFDVVPKKEHWQEIQHFVLSAATKMK